MSLRRITGIIKRKMRQFRKNCFNYSQKVTFANSLICVFIPLFKVIFSGPACLTELLLQSLTTPFYKIFCARRNLTVNFVTLRSARNGFLQRNFLTRRLYCEFIFNARRRIGNGFINYTDIKHAMRLFSRKAFPLLSPSDI